MDHDYRPFIVVNTHTNRPMKRQRRSINCSAGVSECCREKLYISFAEIGWNDWILHPTGYDAYFCRGSCASAATITLSGSHYNTVVRVSIGVAVVVVVFVMLLLVDVFIPTDASAAVGHHLMCDN